MNGPQTRKDELDELVTQMKELGATENQIEERTAHLRPDDHYEIYEKNWPAITWFCEVKNMLTFQNNSCMGLNVLAIESDARLSGRQIIPRDYKKLKYLGDCIAEQINKRQRKR